MEDREQEVSDFLLLQMKEKQPRDDYLEFIKLSLIFLGKVAPQEVSFHVPGAYHHARWMSKAIYCLKIFIFKDQFSMSEEELTSIRSICLFILNLYVKMWFQAPNAITAPNDDFKFIQQVINYKQIDEGISEKVLGKYLNHLWYLSAEQVCFGLFDRNVSNETKRSMAKKILEHTYEDERSTRIVRPIICYTEAVRLLKAVSLDYFVTDQSVIFFERYKINTDFLMQDPCKHWLENQEYLKLKSFVRGLRVVNDTAERGVKLIQDFNNKLTKDEEQKKFLL